MSNCQK